MKAEKIKTIVITVLAVLLTMSVFSQILFFSLLGISNVEDFKQAMLAKELLNSLESTSPEFTNPEPTYPNTEDPDDTEVNNPTTSTLPSTDNLPQTNSSVLMDNVGIKITFTGLEYDSFWERFRLKCVVENNSGVDLTITSIDEVIDGFMLTDTLSGFYCEVLNGRKAVEYIDIYMSDLEVFSISTPKVFEFKFKANCSNDILATLVETETVTIEFT